MDQTRQELEQRMRYLEQLEKRKAAAIRNAPEGKLRINKTDKKTEFFLRADSHDYNGTYISKKNRKLIQRLAQKDYDKRILNAVESERKAVQRYLSICPKLKAEEIYAQLPDVKKALIKPIEETDEMYVETWNAVVYQGKKVYEDGPEFFTDRGERVRSKSEIIIANQLYKKGIPYRYEYPLELSGFGTVYPDFTVLNVRLRKEIIWEHFGRMDDPEYAEKTIKKIETYQKNGLFLGDRFIATWETSAVPINIKTVNDMIQRYCL